MNNNSATFPTRQLPEFHIKRLTLVPMASHPQQYRRAFNVNLTDSTLLGLRTASARMQHYRHLTADEINPKLVVPFMHNFVQPQTEGVPVDLPAANGLSWESEVASFIMEVETTLPGMVTPMKSIIAGFTDRPVPRDGSAIDPDTRFFLNSVFDYRKMAHFGVGGPVEREHLQSASQVLGNPRYHNIDAQPNLHRTRPFEIMTAATRLIDPMLRTHGGVVTIDTRDIQSNHATFSDYKNNDPIQWMQSLLMGNLEAINAQQLGMMNDRSEIDYRHHVARHVRDEDARRSPFLRVMSQITDSYDSQFRLADLLRVDEKVLDVTQLVVAEPVKYDVFFSSLEGKDADTQAANYVLNSVPAIMAKHNVRLVDFGGRNFDNPAQIVVTQFAAVVGDLTPDQFSAFTDELRVRVFDVISNMNERSYMYSASFNLFGTSHFSIELDRQGTRHYASPTFANSVFSPMLTTDHEQLDQMATVIDNVMQSIRHEPMMLSAKDAAALEAQIQLEMGAADWTLSPDALDAKYNPEGEGEHPLITRAVWRHAVEQQETISGYWTWVAHRLQQLHEGN